ncbi:hypothetical protein GGD92_08130 [Pseudomonas protegens]|uniref:Peptidase C1A papain C-terminal domain-containing protein n=1 Tax=Pseudomonas protegens TaxID=380021 RepID=A0A7G7XE15_9PSED|nr:hypothetical protein [Pseudomonas protegens]QNH78210.1 hypothetical protein GGI48_03205 [Pseudomonas protegens]QNL07406.1 hypothetical protein GGD92_08130 [Pseudomonas protegens]
MPAPRRAPWLIPALIPALIPLHLHAAPPLLALVPLPAAATPAPNSLHLLDNMPLATSQQGLGLCFSHSAAAVFNYYQCQAAKEDCTRIDKHQLAAPLDMARYGRKPTGEVDSVGSYEDIDEGGDPLYTLENAALMVGTVVSQACFSEEKLFKDKFVPSGAITAADVKAQRAVLKALEDFYQQHRLKAPCADCVASPAQVAELQAIYATPRDARGIAQALGKPHFGGFFSAIIIPPECRRLSRRALFELKDKLQIRALPETSQQKHFAGLYPALTQAIDAGNPVIIANVCLYRDAKQKKCPEQYQHSLVAYGHARLCTPQGQCQEGLKVLNSWGQQWQEHEGQQWFDARRLLDSTGYGKQSIGWLERKHPPEH